MDDEQASLDKPPRRQRLARNDDDGDSREIWHVIHEHDGKLRAIDKDLIEMKRRMNELPIQVAVLEKTVDGISAKFDARMIEQFLLHEKREQEMHMRVMVRGILMLIGAFGALAYFILGKIAMATGGAA